ncbi:MAG: hypothetical protein PF450_16965, partial [Bacteroidales bacterium]|nr:hypothetical protein [Bacteroidales bacterium]
MSKGILFILIILTACFPLHAQKVSLLLSGNEKDGYEIEILYGARKVTSSKTNGEFNLVIENSDHSITDTLSNWKAHNVTQYSDGIKLSGQYYLENLMTYISIELDYYIINDYVVKKEINFEQNNIPLLFYQVESRLSPNDKNVSYWSFEQLNHKGGSIREIYPAAGFLLDDSIAVGLLTDAGYRNQWTRNIRKRPSDQRTSNAGFKAVQTIADVNLYRIENKNDNLQNNQYISLSFGELSDYNAGTATVLKNEFVSDLIPYKSGTIKKLKGNDSGIKIPFTTNDGFYTIKFKYKTEQPFNLRLLKTINNNSEVIGFHYKSGIPASAGEWLSFEESALLQGLESSEAQLLIESKSDILIKDFEIIVTDPKKMPYHRMPLGEKQTKTIFTFVQPAKNLRDIQLACQTRLAEGLGFDGSDVEKVLYSDFMMLTWISCPQDFSPHNVPSINYAPDMYNRDAFWSVVSVYDKELNEAIWNKWGGTQDNRGAIGTIITPYMGSVEKKGNEATCEWIWWGLINKRRFNSSLDTLRLKKALELCIQECA